MFGNQGETAREGLEYSRSSEQTVRKGQECLGIREQTAREGLEYSRVRKPLEKD